MLRNGIPDSGAQRISRAPAAPLTFVMSGTIEPRKGQDLLVEAIALLPPRVRQQCRFLLTGKLQEAHKGFWAPIISRMQELPEVEYLGLLDHCAHIDLLAASDIIVCCSRDESCSMVVMEAAMLSKPVVLSDHVGAREQLDAEAYFVFESGSAASLAAQLLRIYEFRASLQKMGAAARRSFEKEMTLEDFGRRFRALLAEQVAEDVVPAADKASERERPRQFSS